MYVSVCVYMCIRFSQYFVQFQLFVFQSLSKFHVNGIYIVTVSVFDCTGVYKCCVMYVVYQGIVKTVHMTVLYIYIPVSIYIHLGIYNCAFHVIVYTVKCCSTKFNIILLSV